MKTYVGIDFGACNIKAAKISSQNNRVQHIKLNKQAGGGSAVPNIILYDKVNDDVEIKVGIPAKNSVDVENKVWQIKSKLSQRDWKKHIDSLGREITAYEVVKDTLNWTWQRIVGQSSKETDFEAVITVPVAFSEVQKNLMRKAALEVGIPVVAVITEPFAAMFSLEEDLDEVEEAVFLIFDFGGSTLDMSLFRIERDDDDLTITELAASGLNYGGIDIDKAIFKDIFGTKYQDEVKEILDGNESRLKIELMDLIAKMKENIFIDNEEEVKDMMSDAVGNLHKFELTRDEILSLFDKVDIKAKIITLIEEMLDDADVDKEEVTAIKLFGGTSSINYFWKMLTEYFGSEVFDCDDFEIDLDDIYQNAA